MLYRIKEGMKDELLQGRTISYVADLCGCSRQYLNLVLNGSENKQATKEFVENLIISLAKDSLKINRTISFVGLDNTIKYFFEEIK